MREGMLSALVAAACAGLIGCGDSGRCECASLDTASPLSCSPQGQCEGGFEAVGHSDLGGRGMNAGLALAGDYAYVGSRTDGVIHDHAGIMIVDVSDPANPDVVGEIGPPDEALVGLSSRELRAVPDKNLLVVLEIQCGVYAYDCSQDSFTYPATGGIAESDSLKLYDIQDPLRPKRVGTYDFGANPLAFEVGEPHEFFLWRDPNAPDRILLFVSIIAPQQGIDVIDISIPETPTLITRWDPFANGMLTEPRIFDTSVHSVSASDDGRTLYVAQFGAGFYMLDASEIADNAPDPHLQVLTPLDRRVDYSPPYSPRLHSAVPIPGRPLVLLGDEVLGVEVDLGCPWAWARMVDVSDPTEPRLFESIDPDDPDKDVIVSGQLRLPENYPETCEAPELSLGRVHSSHNPTVTENLALITWYASGLQAFDLSNPESPVRVGSYRSEIAAAVDTEDPVLGGEPIAAWSYPIIRDGLVYFVDVRNGLQIVRYSGPFAEEISGTGFREGNSNLR